MDICATPQGVGNFGLGEWRNSISSWKLRNFIGLAFPDDSSWTLYETHKSGARTKTLPFLRRRTYQCAWGKRKGRTYLPEMDIFPGANLFVKYEQPGCAPEALKRFLVHTNNVLRIRVMTVDTCSRKKALEAELTRQQLPRGMWFSVLAKLHIARLPMQPSTLTRLFRLQALWRRVVRARSKPAEAYANLYRYYGEEMPRQMRALNSKPVDTAIDSQMALDSVNLSRHVLEKGLRWFKLPELTRENLDLVWESWQATAGYYGCAHFIDYQRMVFGELPESRRQLVMDVFSKMDPCQLGHVKLLDMCRFYTTAPLSAKEFDPKVIYSAHEMHAIFSQFIASPTHVDLAEFEAFYQGVSIGLGDTALDRITHETDTATVINLLTPDTTEGESREEDRFQRLLRTCWGLECVGSSHTSRRTRNRFRDTS